jgi:CheY-like chemotaxis protein
VAKILVVDDNAVNRRLLVAILSNDGHLTIEAQDGAKGLLAAKAERPQLVISDIVMPSMDGFGLVQGLRADAELRDIRIIFHTAIYHAREALNLARDCDVACVLVKPCPPDAILKAVDQALARVSESTPSAAHEGFDHEHLILITNKLSEKCAAIEAANSRFAALLELNIELAAQSDSRVMLERACAGARNLLGAAYAVLAVFQDDGVTMRYYTSSGIDQGGSARPPPAPQSGSLHSMMVRRRSWHALGSDGANVEAGLPIGYPPARALLAVSLDDGRRGIGWLYLADKVGAAAFDEDDERLLVGFGAFAGRMYQGRALLP